MVTCQDRTRVPYDARMQPASRISIGLGAGLGLTVVATRAASAHGDLPAAPTFAGLVTTWSGELLVWLGVAVATGAYLVGVWIVNRAHPATRVPKWRVAAWLAGIGVIVIALGSAIDVYADAIFSVHMVQHLLLAMVAPPLLAMGAPATIALRAASPKVRRSVMLPVLHSRLARAVSWPPVAWIAFAVVMWATHFSPLFNAALENDGLHSLEHLLFLAAGLLFWWPVIGADPMRWRLRPIPRMVYLAAQMPLNTAVGLAIYFAPTILYAHYATIHRSWGPDPFTDQQIAGIVMWGAGDLILLGALVLAVATWLRADQRDSLRTEERARRSVDRATVETR